MFRVKRPPERSKGNSLRVGTKHFGSRGYPMTVRRWTFRCECFRYTGRSFTVREYQLNDTFNRPCVTRSFPTRPVEDRIRFLLVGQEIQKHIPVALTVLKRDRPCIVTTRERLLYSLSSVRCWLDFGGSLLRDIRWDHAPGNIAKEGHRRSRH